MLRLTKRYQFAASHRLHAGQLSEAENVRLFGKCNNPYGHGHNYFLEISVSGAADPRSGMLVARPLLDQLVEQAVLSKVDQVNLNTDVPEFRNVIPTTENLTLLIHRWLLEAWEESFGGRPLRLDRVKVDETARNRFEVKN